MAKDGPGALAAARKQMPDLIVLDIMMPDMDGFDVGADDYLTKPFQADEFVAHVTAILRRRSGPSAAPPPAKHTWECPSKRRAFGLTQRVGKAIPRGAWNEREGIL